VPDRFSGTWTLNDGRTIPIRSVTVSDGANALRALGGTPCTRPARYFRSTYFSGVATMAACATGDGKVASGRFNDNGIKGTLTMRLQRPNRFLGIVHGDGHAPFDVVAVRH
jgi:hypothetical protein